MTSLRDKAERERWLVWLAELHNGVVNVPRDEAKLATLVWSLSDVLDALEAEHETERQRLLTQCDSLARHLETERQEAAAREGAMYQRYIEGHASYGWVLSDAARSLLARAADGDKWRTMMGDACSGYAACDHKECKSMEARLREVSSERDSLQRRLDAAEKALGKAEHRGDALEFERTALEDRLIPVLETMQEIAANENGELSCRTLAKKALARLGGLDA